MDILIKILVCLLAGVGAGLGTGFAGMSASAVITPVLIVLLDVEPYTAVGIALASDVLASGVSVITYRKNKNTMLYLAAAIFSAGLLGMYFAKGVSKGVCLVTFGVAGFVMITGYILISALCGSLVRDHTAEGEVGKLQGVRMVFSVLIPMLVGPMIGNGINAKRNIPLPDMGSADVMTTQYIPAPEIFLAGALFSLLMFALIPVLVKISKEKDKRENV